MSQGTMDPLDQGTCDSTAPVVGVPPVYARSIPSKSFHVRPVTPTNDPALPRLVHHHRHHHHHAHPPAATPELQASIKTASEVPAAIHPRVAWRSIVLAGLTGLLVTLLLVATHNYFR